MRKLSDVYEIELKGSIPTQDSNEDEVAGPSVYTLFIKPEFYNVFRLMGFSDVCSMWKQNKELAYRLYESKIHSFLKSINNG